MAITAKPVIGYDNLLEHSGGVITATTETTGFEKENAYDWRTNTSWKTDYDLNSPQVFTHYLTVVFSTQKTCDYFAYFAHNLYQNSHQIQLQYSDDQSPASWLNATTLETPQNSRPRMQTFTAKSSTSWRVKVVVSSSSPVRFFLVSELM